MNAPMVPAISADHDRGDGAGEGPAFVAVVRQTVAHDERAEVGEAESEGPEDVGVLGDLLGGIGGVVDEELLGSDKDADSGLETFDVERAVLAFELHEVQ